MARLIAAVLSTTTALAFWWGLTEPLALSPATLLALPAALLLVCGVFAGRAGLAAAPCALLFSLFLGSILATQLHQSVAPASAPVSRFGPLLAIDATALIGPLAAAAAIGGVGGLIGERLLPTRRLTDDERRRRL